jgi:hypothetical protein
MKIRLLLLCWLAAARGLEKRIVIGSSKRRLQGNFLNVPSVNRFVYASPIELKAHSDFQLKDMNGDIFQVLQTALTPYLVGKCGPSLKSYNLKVNYDGDQEESDVENEVVTYFQVSVVLEVVSGSILAFTNPSQQTASMDMRSFFEGQELYTFLGELRRVGVNINEIVLEGQEFRSPSFNDVNVDEVKGVPSGATPSTSSSPENGTRRVGIYAAIGAGLFVLVSLMLASTFNKQRRLRLIRSRLSSSFSSSSSSDASDILEPPATRRRTFSDSFLRHPSGGIKPAAIQKYPSFSKDFMKSSINSGLEPPSSCAGAPSSPSLRSEPSYPIPGSDAHSVSVAGDYNVPCEYELKTSPLPEYTTSLKQMREDDEEEFSLPDYSVRDEYSVQLREDNSVYSQSIKGAHAKNNRFVHRDFAAAYQTNNSQLALPKGHKSLNPFGVSPVSSNGSPSGISHLTNPFSPMMSPETKNRATLIMRDGPDMIASTSVSVDNYQDEWSVDSYSTASPLKPPPSRKTRGKKPSSHNGPAMMVASTSVSVDNYGDEWSVDSYSIASTLQPPPPRKTRGKNSSSRNGHLDMPPLS